MNIVHCIYSQCNKNPTSPAVIQLERLPNNQYIENVIYTYQTLLIEAQKLALNLSKQAINNEVHVGLIMGNTPEWILSDIALLLANLIEIPIPLAFSNHQAEYLLQNCQIILTDKLGSKKLFQWKNEGMKLKEHINIINIQRNQCLPSSVLKTKLNIKNELSQDKVIKIIHTSGTTSNPKGVKIRRKGLDILVSSLKKLVNKDDYQRYLNLVPLSLLIEQVTAIYMPLTSGGAIIMPPADILPLGSSGVTAEDRLEIIRISHPSAMTLTPALVEAMMNRIKHYGQTSNILTMMFGQEKLPLLAAGGAPIRKNLLIDLERVGIPIYQGYGLSENSSVVTWNSRQANRFGTVGKPLSHVEIKISDRCELLIRSTSLFAGYSNEDPTSCLIDEEGWLHTGDLATQDEDGYISIIGRSKNMIITTNGRNISPEWLEAQYRTILGVNEVIVYGDEQQYMNGIIIIDKQQDPLNIKKLIQNFSQKNLSQIESINHPILFYYNQQIIDFLFTITGRPKRNQIPNFLQEYKGKIL